MPSENIFVVIDNEWINNEGDNLGKDLHSPKSNKKKKKKQKKKMERRKDILAMMIVLIIKK